MATWPKTATMGSPRRSSLDRSVNAKESRAWFSDSQGSQRVHQEKREEDVPLSDYQKSLMSEIDRGLSLPRKMDAIERDYAEGAMYLAQGVVIRAAALLGISKPAMKSLVKKHRLEDEFGRIGLNRHTEAPSRAAEIVVELQREPWARRLRDTDWAKMLRVVEGETDA